MYIYIYLYIYMNTHWKESDCHTQALPYDIVLLYIYNTSSSKLISSVLSLASNGGKTGHGYYIYTIHTLHSRRKRVVITVATQFVRILFFVPNNVRSTVFTDGNVMREGATTTTAVLYRYTKSIELVQEMTKRSEKLQRGPKMSFNTTPPPNRIQWWNIFTEKIVANLEVLSKISYFTRMENIN